MPDVNAQPTVLNVRKRKNVPPAAAFFAFRQMSSVFSGNQKAHPALRRDELPNYKKPKV
jgi:hypothetical protein